MSRLPVKTTSQLGPWINRHINSSKILSPRLFNARALLLVGVVGQFEVFGHVVVPGRLLDLDLLRELEDLLLQLGDGLLCALWVRGAILGPRERTVRPAGDSERCLAQPAHLQSIDLRRRGIKGSEKEMGGVREENKKGDKQGRKRVNGMWMVFENFADAS